MARKKLGDDFNILENALLFAPEGTPLWSDVEGVVVLDKYHDKSYLRNEDYPYSTIHTEDGCYSLNGHYQEVGISDKGFCTLWPSRTHRSWEDWQKVLFKPGDFIYDTHKKRVVKFSYLMGVTGYWGKLDNGKNTEGCLMDCRYASMEQIDEFKSNEKKKSKLEVLKRFSDAAIMSDDDEELQRRIETWNKECEVGLDKEEISTLVIYIFLLKK